MSRNDFIGVCLALALTASACNDQKNDPTAPAPAPGTSELQQSAFTVTPPFVSCRPPCVSATIGDPSRLVQPEVGCDDNTAINDFFLTRAFQIPFPKLSTADQPIWADLVPTYEALLFQTRNSTTFFGYNGEYNQRMNKTERDVKRFWDIKSDDIQVLAMHGTVLADPARTVPTYENENFPVFVDHATATAWAADDQRHHAHRADGERAAIIRCSPSTPSLSRRPRSESPTRS